MEIDPDSRDLFAGRPWRKVPGTAFGRAVDVPGMLTEREQRLYLWLARDWAQGAGAIVDLGCFLGGSTAFLAEGRAQAGRPQPIHAFDRFRISDDLAARYLKGPGLADTSAFVARSLSPWAPEVILHAGDLLEAEWREGPIEVLVVDAAKTVEVADHIARQFYTALIPGRSVVVQQDALHWRQPWVSAQMAWMGAAFVPVGRAGRDLVAYLCVAPVEAPVLEQGRVTGRTDAELMAGLVQAETDLAAIVPPGRIAAQMEALSANPGRRKAKAFRRAV
jgi:predicted O-methyltransferase YrrM